MNKVIDYKNEDEFKQLERCLKKYNMIAYKKLVFDIYPKLRSGEVSGNKVGDNYELKLPTDSMFSKVYGDIKLIYKIEEDSVILLSIEPRNILKQGHHSELMCYKGVMISKENADKEKFKIDLLNMLNK